MRPEGKCQLKIPITPLGIEPATYRLVAQCLKGILHIHFNFQEKERVLNVNYGTVVFYIRTLLVIVIRERTDVCTCNQYLRITGGRFPTHKQNSTYHKLVP